jgi:hypothetical protein
MGRAPPGLEFAPSTRAETTTRVPLKEQENGPQLAKRLELTALHQKMCWQSAWLIKMFVRHVKPPTQLEQDDGDTPL